MIKTVLFSGNSHHRTTVNKITGQQCLFIRSTANMAEAIRSLPGRKLCIIDIDSPENYGMLFMQAMNLKEAQVILLCPKTLMQGKVSMKTGKEITLLRKPFTEDELYSVLPDCMPCKQDRIGVDIFEILFKGISENSVEVRNKARLYAANDDIVLLYGETGTGKEVISKAIAMTYNRSKERVVVNCGQMNSELCESALFGADKGAYTGSVSAIKGYAEEADGTCLVLDEIENLSHSAQSMLLRFIEDRKYRPLGYYGNEMRMSSGKIILISNQSPKKLMEEGKLRNDLYHRISGQVIRIRPLRDRKEDIPVLISFHEEEKDYSERISDFTPFLEYEWPGNVRQLFKTVEHMHRTCTDGRFVFSLPDDDL